MNRQILMVGLSDNAIEKVREAVGSRGVQYHVARNIRGGIELVDLLEPSVVVTVEQLPDGTGFDLCEQIKQEKFLQYVGVVILATSTAGYDHSRSVLVGVDGFVEAEAPIDLVSDRILEIAEKKENTYPLEKRASSNERSLQMDDTTIIYSDDQYNQKTPIENKEIFTSGPERTMVSPSIEEPGQSTIYHGFDYETEAAPSEAESNTDIFHGLNEGTHTETDDDPLTAFFADHEEGATGGVQQGLPPNPNQTNLIARLKQSGVRQLGVINPLHGEIAVLGPQISQSVSRHMDDFLQNHMGRRVDDNLLQEARRILEPLIIRTVDQAIKTVVG